MKRFDREEATSLFIVFAAIAAIPSAIWLLCPRPLSAASPGEFTVLVRDSRQEEIVDQMSQRYAGFSLNMEGPDPGTDPVVRWREIEDSIQRAGAEPDAAHEVVRAAKVKLGQDWPCLAERAYLRGQPVWLVTGSIPQGTGDTLWICPPSADELRQEKVGKYCSNVHVAVISAEQGHPLLN